MNNKTSICAVIVTYEPGLDLIRLYNSIKNQVDEILVVDNNSLSKESIQNLKTLETDNINIIYNKTNLGIAYALNQGVKYAISKKNYKWVLTLDQDSEFFPNTYSLLLSEYEKLEEKNEVMIIAPKIIERVNINENKKNLPQTNSVKWKNVVLNLTSGSLIKIESFLKIGFFDNDLFIEQVDNDFCYRLIKNKYKIKVATNVFFIQEIGNSKKMFGCIVRNHKPIRKYYLSRNVTLMLKRYWLVSPYTTVRYFLGGTIFSWIKILLFEKNKNLKILSGAKGFVHGILNRNMK